MPDARESGDQSVQIRADKRRYAVLAGAGIVILALALMVLVSRGRGHGGQAGAGHGAVKSLPAAGAGPYFVGGFVDRPGAYSISGSPVSLRQALSQAGPQGGGGNGAFVTITRNLSGESELIKVDLGPLLRDGTGDEWLQPYDQVLVADGW
jgi:hypothetical protein